VVLLGSYSFDQFTHELSHNSCDEDGISQPDDGFPWLPGFCHVDHGLANHQLSAHNQSQHSLLVPQCEHLGTGSDSVHMLPHSFYVPTFFNLETILGGVLKMNPNNLSGRRWSKVGDFKYWPRRTYANIPFIGINIKIRLLCIQPEQGSRWRYTNKRGWTLPDYNGMLPLIHHLRNLI